MIYSLKIKDDKDKYGCSGIILLYIDEQII
jgi:hypothetical protein